MTPEEFEKARLAVYGLEDGPFWPYLAIGLSALSGILALAWLFT